MKISNLKILLVLGISIFLTCQNSNKTKVNKLIEKLKKNYENYQEYKNINEIIKREILYKETLGKNVEIIIPNENEYLHKGNIKEKIEESLNKTNLIFDSLLYCINDVIKYNKLKEIYEYGKKLGRLKDLEYVIKNYQTNKKIKKNYKDLFYFY